jgi:hypothetical protein
MAPFSPAFLGYLPLQGYYSAEASEISEISEFSEFSN